MFPAATQTRAYKHEAARAVMSDDEKTIQVRVPPSSTSTVQSPVASQVEAARSTAWLGLVQYPFPKAAKSGSRKLAPVNREKITDASHRISSYPIPPKIRQWLMTIFSSNPSTCKLPIGGAICSGVAADFGVRPTARRHTSC
ncbi:hypothetical protein Trisim1_012427 [Trichoderma cf. simile WF8]